jgi:hypothetical protein
MKKGKTVRKQHMMYVWQSVMEHGKYEGMDGQAAFPFYACVCDFDRICMCMLVGALFVMLFCVGEE